jgi:hypothetical protein
MNAKKEKKEKMQGKRLAMQTAFCPPALLVSSCDYSCNFGFTAMFVVPF